MLRNCLAYFFPKFTDMKMVYKLLRIQLSLFTTFHVFFFQFIFVLLARYVRMCNFTGKSEQMQVVYLTETCAQGCFCIWKREAVVVEVCNIEVL